MKLSTKVVKSKKSNKSKMYTIWLVYSSFFNFNFDISTPRCVKQTMQGRLAKDQKGPISNLYRKKQTITYKYQTSS